MNHDLKMLTSIVVEISNDLKGIGVHDVEDFSNFFRSYGIKKQKIFEIIFNFHEKRNAILQISRRTLIRMNFNDMNFFLNKLFAEYGTDFHLFFVFYLGQDWVNSINIHDFNTKIQTKVCRLQSQMEIYTNNRQLDHGITDEKVTQFSIAGPQV